MELRGCRVKGCVSDWGLAAGLGFYPFHFFRHGLRLESA